MLRIEEVLQSGKPIFVKNMTSPKGQIILTVGDPATGRIHKVIIPKINLPVCISDRLSPALIQASTDLRSFISKGVLELCDSDKAMATLAKEGNDQLVANALAKAENASTISQFAAREAAEKKDFEGGEAEVAEVASTQRGMDDDENHPNDFVVTTLQQVKDGDVKVRDGLTEIRNIEDTLTLTDLNYIIAEMPEGLIRKYATVRLAEMLNADTGATTVEHQDTDEGPK